MSLVLAMDSSTAVQSLALVEEHKILCELQTDAARYRAENIVSSVDWLLRTAQRRLSDVALFAVGQGPGSFTGLRIAMATAQGFALAFEKPMVAVPTLDALVWNAYGVDSVYVFLEARMGEVFGAYYRRQPHGWHKERAEWVGPVENFLEDAEDAPFILGDATLTQRERILACRPKARLGTPFQVYPRAVYVAMEGLARWRAGAPTDPTHIAPLYLRPSQAEQNLQKSGKTLVL
jgi:tRNA threonylcarbamoyladenosine biosynthesis protein TsaB